MRQVDEGMLHAWLDGELPEAEAAEIARLVRDDAAWAAAAAEARGLMANASRLVAALDDGVVGGAGGGGGRAPAATAPRRQMSVVRGAGLARLERTARRVAGLAAVALVAVLGRAGWEISRPVEVASPGVAALEVARSEVATPQVVLQVTPAPVAPKPAEPPVVVAAGPPAAPPPPLAEVPALLETAPTAAAGAMPVRAEAKAMAQRLDVEPDDRRASAERRSAAWLQEGACLRFEVALPAEGSLPAAEAEFQSEPSRLQFDADSVRLRQEIPAERRDGTPVPATVHLAVSRRTGTGVARLVRPDGEVVRRGTVERTRRCP